MNLLIHWKEEYSVNIEELDQQHKKLIDMINQVYDSVIRNEKDDILEQTFSDMADYTFIHFTTEEKYFAQLGYERAAAHIAEHQLFLDKVEQLHSDYRVSELFMKHEVFVFLHDWFNNHILHSDKAYMECFHNAGLK